MGAAASLARVMLALVALQLPAPAVTFAAAPRVPTVVVGSGRSELLEYDRGLELLRRYVGFERPVDVTATPEGTLLIVDEGSHKVIELGRDGAVLWSDGIGDYPLRARLRPQGGLLVSAAERVIALRPDRTVDFEISVPGLRAAVPLPNGNVVVAYNERQGWLAEMTREGEVVRRSAVSGYVDAAGRWVDEDPGRYFMSVSSLDVAPDGTIFAANFDGADVRLLAPDLRVVQSFGGFAHSNDTRFGPDGELVAVSAEQARVWIRWGDRRESQIDAPMEPRCANVTPWGTIVVGMWWNPEKEVLNASALRSLQPAPTPWWQRGLPLPVAGALLSLLVAWRVRRPELERKRMDEITASTARPELVEGRIRNLSTAARIAAAVACAALVAGGLVLTWGGIQLIYALRYAEGTSRFVLGGILSGLALRLLNAVIPASATLSTLEPARWNTLLRRSDHGRTELLFAGAMFALAGCMAVQLLLPTLQAAGIAFWIAAQVWILASAFPPERPVEHDRTAPRWTWPLLALLLAGTLATRLWQIGYYPDSLHSDHNLYGISVLHLLRGDWRPFFVLDPVTSTYGRPWLVPAAAAMELLGPGYGMLRVTSALSSVLMVWGTYLLATALFNRRVGLIAGFLVAVNHALLLYSRQPYVIESTAPFLLLLYCAFTGARRGCLFHWCLAGVVAGWAMLSPRQSTMFPLICGAIFLYCAVVHPRAAWRQRGGIGWMIAGAAAVYLPMVPHMLSNTALSRRLSTVTVFLNPDGSMRWDRALWQDQIVRSFGSIVYFHDASAWGVGTWQPICLKLEACLFAVGLVYLLTSWRGLATFTVLATIVLSIFLGSVLLTSPPTFYHYFVGMVAVLIVCAVALDRIAATFDRWPRLPRALAAAVLVAFLALVGFEHLSFSWRAVRRPQREGREVFAADAAVVAARLIRQRPEYRYYLVRSMRDHSATSPEFFFATADSDVSDISTDLRLTLPVAPVDGGPGAVFVVLPSRSKDRQVIAEIYPAAKSNEIPCAGVDQSVWVYEVGADEIERVALR